LIWWVKKYENKSITVQNILYLYLNMYEVIFTPKAEFDLSEIYAFIALDNEFYAEKVFNKIIDLS